MVGRLVVGDEHAGERADGVEVRPRRQLAWEHRPEHVLEEGALPVAGHHPIDPLVELHRRSHDVDRAVIRIESISPVEVTTIGTEATTAIAIMFDHRMP